MSPLRTFYRLIVMVAAGVIVVKGWQLYGPSTESVKAFTVIALEKAQAAWNSSQGESLPATLAEDPRPRVASLDTGGQGNSGTTAPPFVAAGGTPTAPELGPTTDAATASASAASPVDPDSERMSQLLARLDQMGCAQPQLAAWGSSGTLHRFSCRARLGDSPAVAQHFEAVADKPVEAVEQVVAHVEAWRERRESR
jgi:hypothetical protein